MSSFNVTLHLNVAAIHVTTGNYGKAMVRARMALAAANRTKDAEARKVILRTIGKLNRLIDCDRIRVKASQLQQELSHA